MLTNMILRLRYDDLELLKLGLNSDTSAKSQFSWNQTIGHLKEAKKMYNALRENKREPLLKHGRLAQFLVFPRINSFELEEQLNYAKKIFEKYNSDSDLYKLGLHAEIFSAGIKSDVENIVFLEYARDLFANLGKEDDIKRLVNTANRRGFMSINGLSRERFYDFADKNI